MKAPRNSAQLTRTLSVRLPNEEADAVRTAAAALHISTSSYIADALRGRSRRGYPALAALGEVIALAHILRANHADDAAMAELQAAISDLHRLVRDEIAP